ncbi:MAG TPA: ABC transporter permease [Methylomirabilota bacterium]|jgi:putative spermidine/putrescine transport system permease protein|nr:ABC transporter permease [Methylomirabilota bacterium]
MTARPAGVLEAVERVGGVLLRALAVLTFVYLLLPIAVIVGASFTASDFLAFPPRGLTLRWYWTFTQTPGWLDSFTLSLELAAATTGLATAIGVPAALALARSRFRGQRLLSGLFLSPLVLPQVVLGVGLLQYLTLLGIARTFWAILIGHVLLTLPYIIRSVMATLAGVDPALEEAAADLGASPPVAFLTVTLPVIQGGVIAGALFAFVISWTNVEVTMFFTTSRLNPLPVNIMNYIAYNVDPLVAAVSAASVYVSFVVLLLIDATVGLDRFAETRPR